MDLSASEKAVLSALAAGWTLKSHRYLDGRKEYRLHPLAEGEVQAVSWETMERLRERALIDSNKKFPAATYLLTDRGKAVVAQLPGQQGREPEQGNPLTTSGWE